MMTQYYKNMLDSLSFKHGNEAGLANGWTTTFTERLFS